MRTASGRQRATVTSRSGMVSQGRLTGAPLKSTIGKTSAARLNMGLTRPSTRQQQQSYNAARTQAQASRKPAAVKGQRLGGARQTMRTAAPSNTVANRTGQRKTLNKFNSRPAGTMVPGKGINLVPSPTRVPLQISTSGRDAAFARTATKSARSRSAMPAKVKQKESTASRASRAAANQKRVTQSVMAKGGKRPTPSKKQRRSILTAEAAKRFYSTNAVDTLRVNVKRPGFRQPRPVTRFARTR